MAKKTGKTKSEMTSKRAASIAAKALATKEAASDAAKAIAGAASALDKAARQRREANNAILRAAAERFKPAMKSLAKR
jgi:hypothetical protein